MRDDRAGCREVLVGGEGSEQLRPQSRDDLQDLKDQVEDFVRGCPEYAKSVSLERKEANLGPLAVRHRRRRSLPGLRKLTERKQQTMRPGSVQSLA